MKLVGAILIAVCCGWFGFSMAAAHRTEERLLRQLISALDYMQCELQYKLTALPQLCKQVSGFCKKGPICQFFLNLSGELEQQIAAEAQPCVEAALARTKNLPLSCQKSIQELGKSLGQFDLDGQVLGLEAMRNQCRETLAQLCLGKDEQRRSYQTLGLCAGAALVILLI